jgi:hypothetical protein
MSIENKLFKVEFELKAQGDKRIPAVSAKFAPGQEFRPTSDQYEKEYDKLHEAARSFCQFLIDSREL